VVFEVLVLIQKISDIATPLLTSSLEESSGEDCPNVIIKMKSEPDLNGSQNKGHELKLRKIKSNLLRLYV
jgi:hypothetical protein